EVKPTSKDSGTIEFKGIESGKAWVTITYEDEEAIKSQTLDFIISDEEYHDENNTSSDVIKGDANCDGTVDMGDVVLIMQALANPNKYGVNGSNELHITLQGAENGDVDTSVKGLTVGDALKIQRYLLGDEKSL
ncbi:hypothetical protein SAMN04487860_102336, partial [Ruminococcus flavefaciens]